MELLGKLMSVALAGYLMFLIVGTLSPNRYTVRMFKFAVFVLCFVYAMNIVNNTVEATQKKIDAVNEKVEGITESLNKVGEGLEKTVETPGNTVKYVEEKKDGIVEKAGELNKKYNPFAKKESD